MARSLKTNSRIWQLAYDLELEPSPDALTAIVTHCVKRVASLQRKAPAETLSELLSNVATAMETTFREIHTDAELQHLKQSFLDRRELAFATIEADLAGADAVTYRLQQREPWERPFVSVIDCRGSHASRAYFSKWHEIAHLLTLASQMRLKFCRTHHGGSQKDPEESLMDVIAGTVGFLPTLVAPHARGPISFEKIDDLRSKLCPEASVQASLLGFVQGWPSSCLLVEARMGYRKRDERALNQGAFDFTDPVAPTLRVQKITSSSSARAANLRFIPNMRVPSNSIIYQAFNGGLSSLEGDEDLGSWVTSEGTRLSPRPVKISARSFPNGVRALVVPRN